MAEVRFRYVRALDGVRSIAIVLVLLFHYPWGDQRWGSNPVGGGFLGVDVFFVLSGFLITSLLLQERADTGAVSLRSFYARRALRLLPAFGVLFAIAIVARFAFVQPAQRPTWFGVFAMAAYFANWVQLWVHEPLGPLFGHTWSLAIEEQFYVVFPLVFVGFAWLRASRRTLGLALFAAAAASAAWRAYLWKSPPAFVDFYARITGREVRGTNPFATWNRWYFGTDTRLDALLIGCVAAVALVSLQPRITPAIRRVLLCVSVVAIVVLGFMVANAAILSDWLPSWGLFVFACLVAVVVVGLVVNPGSIPSRLFGLAPLVWIGRRSYGIYLFHQVVFNQAVRNRTHLPPFWSFWFNMAAILVVAELSWRYVEQPFLRRKGRFARSEMPSQPADSLR